MPKENTKQLISKEIKRLEVKLQNDLKNFPDLLFPDLLMENTSDHTYQAMQFTFIDSNNKETMILSGATWNLQDRCSSKKNKTALQEWITERENERNKKNTKQKTTSKPITIKANNPWDVSETNFPNEKSTTKDDIYKLRKLKQILKIVDTVLAEKDFLFLQEIDFLWKKGPTEDYLKDIFKQALNEAGFDYLQTPSQADQQHLAIVYNTNKLTPAAQFPIKDNQGGGLPQFLDNGDGRHKGYEWRFTLVEDPQQTVALTNVHLNFVRDYSQEIENYQKTQADSDIPTIMGGDTNHPVNEGISGALGNIQKATNLGKVENSHELTTIDYGFKVPKSYDTFFANPQKDGEVIHRKLDEEWFEFNSETNKIEVEQKSLTDLHLEIANEAMAYANSIIPTRNSSERFTFVKKDQIKQQSEFVSIIPGETEVKLSKEKVEEIDQKIKSARLDTNREVSKLTEETFNQAVKDIEASKEGNDDEYALLAFDYIVRNYPNVPVKIYKIAVDSVSEDVQEEADHVFVVINPPNNSASDAEPDNWTKEVIVCDPLTMKSFSGANHQGIKDNLKLEYGMSVEPILSKDIFRKNSNNQVNLEEQTNSFLQAPLSPKGALIGAAVGVGITVVSVIALTLLGVLTFGIGPLFIGVSAAIAVGVIGGNALVGGLVGGKINAEAANQKLDKETTSLQENSKRMDERTPSNSSLIVGSNQNILSQNVNDVNNASFSKVFKQPEKSTTDEAKTTAVQSQKSSDKSPASKINKGP